MMFTKITRIMSINSALLRNHLRAFQQVKYYSENSNRTVNFDPKPKSTRLSLRRQKLPPYPTIETIQKIELHRFLKTNYKTVRHGDYEFKECLEGYVHIYGAAYRFPAPPDAASGFAIYYGKDHPLNKTGPVERRQEINHAKLYAVLQILKQIPQNSFKKVCICLDDLTLIRFLTIYLASMSENAFRSAHTGRLNKDLETNMEVNTLLRTRQDLKLRMHYTPNDIGFPDSFHANKLAIRAAADAEKMRLQTKFRKTNLNDVGF